MTPFSHRDGRFVATFEQIEAVLLTQLVGQIGALLASTDDARPDVPRDAALLRLLPDAYPDDLEASAEFRRFTVEGLAEKKVYNAQRVAADVAGACASVDPSEVTLDDSSVQAWVRSITDVRLVLATRLGIETDDPIQSYDNDEERMLAEVYDWLGWVQGSLVNALDNASGHAA